VFEGIVLVAGPVVDPMTRTAPVELAVENVVEEGEHLLKPGMYADVSVTVGVRTNVLAVPAEAVTTSGGRDVVLAVRFHETYETGAPAGGGLVYSLDSAAIEKGLKSGAPLEIRPGSARGEIVVTSGGGGEVLLVARSHPARKAEGPEQAEDVKGAEDAEEVEEPGATEDIYVIVVLPVEKGLRAGDDVEIISGVEEGDVIVTAGARVLAPGANVRIEPAGLSGPDRRPDVPAGLSGPDRRPDVPAGEGEPR
jgi:multidrug efflux pump subunit AcrA (membrane-fusion protein)